MPYANREQKLQYGKDYYRKRMEEPGRRESERQRMRDRYKSDYKSRVHQYNIKRRLSGKVIPNDEAKRPNPGYCEVCSLQFSGQKADYHHWDGVANLGLWLCINCHSMAEGIDKELDAKYRRIKEEVEKGYAFDLICSLIDAGKVSQEVLDNWKW